MDLWWGEKNLNCLKNLKPNDLNQGLPAKICKQAVHLSCLQILWSMNEAARSHTLNTFFFLSHMSACSTTTNNINEDAFPNTAISSEACCSHHSDKDQQKGIWSFNPSNKGSRIQLFSPHSASEHHLVGRGGNGTFTWLDYWYNYVWNIISISKRAKGLAFSNLKCAVLVGRSPDTCSATTTPTVP